MQPEPTPSPTPDAPTLPEVAPTSTQGAPIGLTAKAVKMIRLTREEEKLAEDAGLRVAVRGGGCSGFEYALDFDSEPRDNDIVIEYEGLNVFVDPISGRYLKGTVIDYVMGVTGTGFKFHNPNAVGSCGCGSSFSV